MFPPSIFRPGGVVGMGGMLPGRRAGAGAIGSAAPSAGATTDACRLTSR